MHPDPSNRCRCTFVPTHPLDGEMYVFTRQLVGDGRTDRSNQLVYRCRKTDTVPTKLLVASGLPAGIYDVVIINDNGGAFKRAYELRPTHPPMEARPA